MQEKSESTVRNSNAHHPIVTATLMYFERLELKSQNVAALFITSVLPTLKVLQEAKYICKSYFAFLEIELIFRHYFFSCSVYMYTS